MLTTKDLIAFKEHLESGGWADAFGYATEELRLEMIEKVEALMDAADVADRVVADVLFSKEGMPAPQESSSEIKGE